MFRIDNVTAVPSLPIAGPAGSPGFFTDGNPAAALEATVVDGWWLNLLQEELLTVITEAGLAPNKQSHTQLYEALNRLYLRIDASDRYLPLTGGTLARPGTSNDPILQIDSAQSFPTLLLHSTTTADAVLHCTNGSKTLAMGVNSRGDMYIADHSILGGELPLIYFSPYGGGTSLMEVLGQLNVANAVVIEFGIYVKGGGVGTSVFHATGDGLFGGDLQVRRLYETSLAGSLPVEIADSPLGLDVVRQFMPRSWLEGEERHHGLIPDEVETVVPELVKLSSPGITALPADEPPAPPLKGIALTPLVCCLVNAVKELADRLDTLMPAERRSQ